jgi:hypothetical protein
VGLGLNADSTLIALVLALRDEGVTPANNPLAAVPISSIPFSSIDLTQVPISSINLGAIPISSIPISSIGSVTIRGVPISSIPIVNGPSDLSGLVTCAPTACPTLGDAIAQGKVVKGTTVGDIAEIFGGEVNATLDFFFGSGKTLVDIVDNLDDATLADLIEVPPGDFNATSVQDLLTALGATPDQVELFLSFFFGDLTIGELYAEGGTLGTLTLGQLLVAILDRDDYPWEELPFAEIAPWDLGANPERVTYQVSINSSLTAPADVMVTLPEQFRYVPGTARFGTAPIEPAGTGRNLRWDALPGQAGQATLSFEAYPGFRTGSTTISASVTIGGQTAQTNGAPLLVEEAFETNDVIEQATMAEADVLYLGHIADPGDVDYFKIEAPPGGARVGYYLSHLSGDVDMVLVKPAPAAQRATAPPLGNGIATDGQAGGIQATGTIPPDPPQQAGGNGFLTVASAHQAGDADETIVQEAATNETYYLKVTSHAGNVSNDAYALRIKFLSPLATPECAPIQFVHAGEGIAATQPMPTGNITSLFIVNQERLGDAFGQVRATMAIDALKLLAASPHLPGNGAILFVDQVAEYSAWDQNPCDPDAANAVVHAINALVDQVRAQSTVELENIVLVGSDEMVPFFRTPDPTLRWNERSYAAGLEGTESGTWGALSTEHILTDAVYGDFDPIPWLDRYLHVPDIGIGRLVETPEEIKLQADLFIASQGKLDPQTGASAGYDFLADGATEVAANLRLTGLDPVIELISDIWSGGDLLQLVKTVPAYDVLSLNAHFDHSRLLPADQDKVVGQQELVETADFADALLSRQIIFTMGCHAGLNMAGYLGTSSPNVATNDWAQTLAGGGAIFVANTGYGYGDTAAVALSEQLMALYAERLDGSVEAGRALALAQQAYMAGLGLYGVYDEKVLMQTTFYGLPMYTVGDPPPGVAAAEPLPTSPGPATGLTIAEVSVSPAFPSEDEVLRTDRGDIWQASPELSTYRSLIEDGPAVPVLDAGTEEAHDRPIQPRVAIDITQSSMTAHGAVIELIQAREDIRPFDPVLHRPVISTAEREPELVATDGNFPGRFQNVTSYLAAEGRRQTLVLIPGQFFFDDEGTGVQRLFDRVDATVYYHASSKDFIQPEITRALAGIKEGAAEFSVAVRDRNQEDGLDDYSGTVVRVVVLIEGEDRRWTPLDLQRDESSGLWSGRQRLPEGTAAVAYFVQAVDSSGNVGVQTNKGAYFEAVEAPAPPRADLAIDINGRLVANSQHTYAGSVTIAITGSQGLALSYSLDGGSATAYEGPFEVGSAGYHTIEAFGSNGTSATRSFFIEREDTGIRRIRVTVPRAGRSYHPFQVEGALTDFTCIDLGSGIKECGGDLPLGFPIPTDTVGMETLRFHLIDGNGQRFTQAVSYTVSDPCRVPPTIVAREGVVVEGTAGNDVIWGTPGPDIIRGNGGNDIICSGAGDDVIETGMGNDYIDAGAGDDSIVDAGGHNLIRGRFGNDTITAGAGDDYIDGGAGDDRISGGAGNDTIDGGTGSDILDGGPGVDECIASRDADTTASCEIVRSPG